MDVRKGRREGGKKEAKEGRNERGKEKRAGKNKRKKRSKEIKIGENLNEEGGREFKKLIENKPKERIRHKSKIHKT